MTTPDINKILADPSNLRNCRRGAPMGDSNVADDLSEPLFVQRVRFEDGCYAPDGTYWGGPADLWCGFNQSAQTVRIYVRANDRKSARKYRSYILSRNSIRHNTVSQRNDSIFLGANHG
jgi:hypothetical protein